jgi:hypothetical protein
VGDRDLHSAFREDHDSPGAGDGRLPDAPQVNAAYAALRDDPRAWADVEAERREWDATLADGLVAAEG